MRDPTPRASPLLRDLQLEAAELEGAGLALPTKEFLRLKGRGDVLGVSSSGGTPKWSVPCEFPFKPNQKQVAPYKL